MYPAEFTYHAPETLADVIALLQAHEDARVLAGGHSLLPMMKLRLAQPEHLISLRRVQELRGIESSAGVLSVGAMTCHREVAFSETVREAVPLLAELASEIADPQVRNRGTIGGSIAHADPAADYPAGLLALDAEIVCWSESGERIVAAQEFFLDMFTTALDEQEVIRQIRFRHFTPTTGSAYVKLRNPASRFAAAGMACVLRFSGPSPEISRLALTGLSTHAFLCHAAQDALRKLSFDGEGAPTDQAAFEACCDLVVDSVEIEDIMNYSANVRRQLARTAAKRAILKAAQRARAAERQRRR